MNEASTPEAYFHDSMRYRLDGMDIIERLVDTLKGGLQGYDTTTGEKIYYEENRLMNDAGVHAIKMLLENAINRDNHLTNYRDIVRIHEQLVNTIILPLEFEIALNSKRWAPEAYYDENGKLINPTFKKIRNKRLIISMVENGVLQSMQRAEKGREADLTAKQYNVQEIKDESKRQVQLPGSQLWEGRR